MNSVKTRTIRTSAFWGYPPPPHDYPYYWFILNPKLKQDKLKVTNLKNLPKLQICEIWKTLYMRHTFWSCLIRCVNMKWIQWVLWKIQSGHHSVHRRTDGRTEGQMDKVKPVYPLQLHWAEGISCACDSLAPWDNGSGLYIYIDNDICIEQPYVEKSTQDCGISRANALEIPQSCVNPPFYSGLNVLRLIGKNVLE